MQCHHCQHAEDIAAGKFKQVPFEETPCAKCDFTDAADQAVDFEDWRGVFDEKPSPSLHVLPVAILGDVVRLLLSLPPPLRDLVCWRYEGVPYWEIANRLGVRTSVVEKRHQRVMQRVPALKALFIGKAVRHQKRKAISGEKTGTNLSKTLGK
jgi:hypothetical protein